ncbi:nuclear transport factor 2 family protein [Devosia albogilva]|uniref:Nuclear transport factor 2 family protein n=1 Tax=Devosia albogilva TaxID=429726 RepID=A0ABW5QN65_9HYPH
MGRGQHRSPMEVFEDHLGLRLEGNLEEDLRRNYAEDVVLLTVNSNATGHEALRMSAERLSRQLPGAEFSIAAKQVSGPYALLIWSATSPRFQAVEGADTFVIRDGKIVLQTIHYGLRHASEFGSAVTTAGQAGGGDGPP